MSLNNVKHQQKFRTNKVSSPATNPLNVGIEEYESLQKLNNTRVIIDRTMFVALGALSIWAFYSALMSLIL